MGGRVFRPLCLGARNLATAKGLWSAQGKWVWLVADRDAWWLVLAPYQAVTANASPK
jgi:hypothetical protein